MLKKIKETELIKGYSDGQVVSYFQGVHDALDEACHIINTREPKSEVDIPIGDLHKAALEVEKEILAARREGESS